MRARNLYFAAETTANETVPTRRRRRWPSLLPRADFPLQMNLAPQFSEQQVEVRVLLSITSGVAGKLDVLIASFDRVFTPVAPL